MKSLKFWPKLWEITGPGLRGTHEKVDFLMIFLWFFEFYRYAMPSRSRLLGARPPQASRTNVVGWNFHFVKNFIEKYFRKIIFRPKKVRKLFFWKFWKNWKIKFYLKNDDFHWKNHFSKFSRFRFFFAKKLFSTFCFRPKNHFSKIFFDEFFFRMKVSSNHTHPWCLRRSCTE